MMGHWIGIVAGIVAAGIGSSLVAQESGHAGKLEGPERRHRFFDRPIDLWGKGLRYSEACEGKAGPNPAGDPSAKGWGEIVRLPNGEVAYQELPRPLVAMLENPTPQAVRGYLEWRLEKMRKILMAAELVREYRDATALPAARKSDEAAVKAARGSAEVRALSGRQGEGTRTADDSYAVTYFRKKG